MNGREAPGRRRRLWGPLVHASHCPLLGSALLLSGCITHADYQPFTTKTYEPTTADPVVLGIKDFEEHRNEWDVIGSLDVRGNSFVGTSGLLERVFEEANARGADGVVYLSHGTSYLTTYDATTTIHSFPYPLNDTATTTVTPTNWPKPWACYALLKRRTGGAESSTHEENGSIAPKPDATRETAEPRTGASGGPYFGIGISHWIEKNIDSGQFVVLEDGSLWEIDVADKPRAMFWLPASTVFVTNSGSPPFYRLVNTADGESVVGRFVGSR